MYPAKALKKHPGANPHRGQLGKRGQFMGIVTRGFRARHGQPLLTLVGPHDASRWLPHQGAQEIARRKRQAERAVNKAVVRAAFKISLSDEYGHIATERAELKRKISNEVVQIIPKTNWPTPVMTSNKPFGEVQDSGNPVGKRVTWSSNGVEKVGEIVAVVPAGKVPSDFHVKVKDAGGPRDHESFAVSANGKNYWPRVSVLKFG